MIVAGIETVWDGHIAPQKRTIKTVNYRTPKEVHLEKGAEMGRFKLGSTAIILFPKDASWADTLAAGNKVEMGQILGAWLSP